MAYFRERNNIKAEYSGYEEASKNLRERLGAIVRKRCLGHVSDPQFRHYVDKYKLDYKTVLVINKDCLGAILQGNYEEVFTAFEIFLDFAKNLYSRNEIFQEAELAFRSAGSVYTITELGQVVLQISEETAKDIKEVESELENRSGDASDFFQRALTDLLSRKRKANDVVKDFAVAMENYLEALTDKKDVGEAIKFLSVQAVIAPTQRLILEKLYAYRGDADGVAHSGNTPEPTEADAVWFLETLVAAIKLIKAKMPKIEKQS